MTLHNINNKKKCILNFFQNNIIFFKFLFKKIVFYKMSTNIKDIVMNIFFKNCFVNFNWNENFKKNHIEHTVNRKKIIYK